MRGEWLWRAWRTHPRKTHSAQRPLEPFAAKFIPDFVLPAKTLAVLPHTTMAVDDACQRFLERGWFGCRCDATPCAGPVSRSPRSGLARGPLGGRTTGMP